jgi:hypothetical protein
MSRLSRIAILATLLAAGLPFVLQRNLYPFFRFGMFAEPVRRTVQQEYFWVEMWRGAAGWKPLPAEALPFGPSGWQQLCRNYHYRGQGESLLQRAQASAKAGGREEASAPHWRLMRMIRPLEAGPAADTACVATWPPPR